MLCHVDNSFSYSIHGIPQNYCFWGAEYRYVILRYPTEVFLQITN